MSSYSRNTSLHYLLKNVPDNRKEVVVKRFDRMFVCAKYPDIFTNWALFQRRCSGRPTLSGIGIYLSAISYDPEHFYSVLLNEYRRDFKDLITDPQNIFNLIKK